MSVVKIIPQGNNNSHSQGRLPAARLHKLDHGIQTGRPRRPRQQSPVRPRNRQAHRVGTVRNDHQHRTRRVKDLRHDASQFHKRLRPVSRHRGRKRLSPVRAQSKRVPSCQCRRNVAPKIPCEKRAVRIALFPRNRTRGGEQELQVDACTCVGRRDSPAERNDACGHLR